MLFIALTFFFELQVDSLGNEQSVKSDAVIKFDGFVKFSVRSLLLFFSRLAVPRLIGL